ncbi:MGMT family protein, partial [Candidatus Woesearchaeota archaeon]|nr:MGMT family protein [Candidatus Woesearchaeota archaeon]
MVTEFQKRVYELCKIVPKGKVTTYREIGNALGGKGQIYRAVGVALNKNPFAPQVPCHRVVNGNGFVGGFA